MPNHAQNVLEIICPVAAIPAVRELLAGPAWRPDVDPGDAAEQAALSFDVLMPIPVEEETADWHAARLRHWGVKCNAYEIEVFEAPTGLVYGFFTAWSNVPRLAEAVARRLHAAGISAEVVYTGAEFGACTYCRVRFVGLDRMCFEDGTVTVAHHDEMGPYIETPDFLNDCGFVPAV